MAATGNTARCGTDGQAHINGVYVPRVKQWSVTCSTSESTWGDSDSVGFTNRKAARRDCTGSITGVQEGGTYDKNKDIMGILAGGLTALTNPTRVVAITLWEESGAAPNRRWWFPSAMVQNFNITYDMDTKEVVEWSLDFASDGVFYRPQEPVFSGDTEPELAYSVRTVIST